jgi:hypothetical protein
MTLFVELHGMFSIQTIVAGFDLPKRFKKLQVHFLGNSMEH